jgi:hypothetical protein
MNRALVAVLLAAAFFGVEASSQAGPANTAARTWDFSADRPGSPPARFGFARTGSGRPGRWVVVSSTEMGRRKRYSHNWTQTERATGSPWR